MAAKKTPAGCCVAKTLRPGPVVGTMTVKPVCEPSFEPAFDTWDRDDIVQAELAVGKFRGAIDAAKAVADKLHRARKCPDRLLIAQFGELEKDISALTAAAVNLAAAFADAKHKVGAR